jgi:uncharacterized repeat protein (TIGR03803 family)
MTTLEALGLFLLMPTRRRKDDSARKLSLSGTACVALVFCVAVPIAAPAQIFTTLVSFDGTNGSYPEYISLVQGFDGNLYGTTAAGAGFPCLFCGSGTVFEMNRGGTLTTLHFFDGTDGAIPYAGLIQATNGNFYGTTHYGGVNNEGTVFGITPGGMLTTLHSFDGTDGSYPHAGLLQGIAGNLFGTAQLGGTNGDGTVFEITPAGKLTTLHSFDGSDGSSPSGLVQATDGIFYGTTFGNAGTVFKITPGGMLTTLHSFHGTDSAYPYAGLVQAANGSFYGTAYSGGANGDGTVFEITPAGKLTTLHSFDGSDGEGPFGPLVQGIDGNFYGTTYLGGANLTDCSSDLGSGCGTVFEITPAGKLTTLHSFDGSDGAYPNGGLVQATDGNFYGATEQGGSSKGGTLFSLSVGLGPFVSLVRSFGTVGRTAQILGQGFTGTTAVSFNGTPASFIVESDTYLTATVPAGASTGVVTVTTPSGTLTSNKTFRVVPQITSFSPTSGPVSTSVVITGESFIGVIDVHFGNVKVTSFTVDSDTQITATVPAGAETGKISVCTAGGSGDSATSFTVTP